MKISILGSIAATLLLSAFAISQSPTATDASPPADAIPATPPPATEHAEATIEQAEPDLQLQPVPPILRLHLPLLGKQPGRELGVIVKSVAPGSEAEKAGLRTGDILLEAGGRLVIAGESLSQMDASQPIVVLRRGRTRVLGPAAMNVPPVGPGHWGPGRWEPQRWGPEQWDTIQGRLSVPLSVPLGVPRKRVPGRKLAPAGPGVSISSSAVTSGTGGRAVSIGRAGDQISLEMSLPGLSSVPIRFRGTLAEIERDLQVSDLNEAAKQEVRSALEQVR